MFFNAENPYSAAKLKSSPHTPRQGTRGFYPTEDGWYDINDGGQTKKFIMSDDLEEVITNTQTKDIIATSYDVESGSGYTNNGYRQVMTLEDGTVVEGMRGLINENWLQFNNVEFTGNEKTFSIDYTHNSENTYGNFDVYIIDSVGTEIKIVEARDVNTGFGWCWVRTIEFPLITTIEKGTYSVKIKGLPMTVHNANTVWTTANILAGFYAFRFIKNEFIVSPNLCTFMAPYGNLIEKGYVVSDIGWTAIYVPIEAGLCYTLFYECNPIPFYRIDSYGVSGFVTGGGTFESKGTGSFLFPEASGVTNAQLWVNTADYPNNELFGVYQTEPTSLDELYYVNTKANDKHIEEVVKAKIITDKASTAFSFDFANSYNSEYRLLADAIFSIDFTFSDSAYKDSYKAWLSFNSGTEPTSLSYTGNGILNWVGTDCYTSGGFSIFDPYPNKHYDVMFYFNGSQFVGLVNGYTSAVPATKNPFDLTSATTTTTGITNLGIQVLPECTFWQSNPQPGAPDALENIRDAYLSYTFNLGSSRASGMRLVMGTPNGSEGYTVTAYKSVEGRDPVKIGSLTIETCWYYTRYIDYFLPFDEDLTGSGTLILSFSNNNATNVDGWVGFSGFNFIDASTTFDAFSEIWRNDLQIAAPQNGVDLNGRGYDWFGDGDVGDYMINPNVDFGNTKAVGIQLYFVTPGTNMVGANASIKIYSDGEEVLSAGADDIRDYPYSWSYVPFALDKLIDGGVHDITVKFSNIGLNGGGSNFGSFRFIPAKDGTQKILAVDCDNANDTGHRANEDGMEYTLGWFGADDGEKAVYNFVDFGNKSMKSMDIRFNAWNDSTEKAKNGDGRIDVYAGEDLIATVTNDELKKNIDKYTTYTVNFAEPLTGLHDITVVSYWQGSLSWIQFKE